ncbi:hypothetical protein [Iodidimonas sp. SYSU 1G8]|uniref:hypothetical protein n=1 Tax=Iodidimonas sp. SYSU 1G8 TaxID=3133967 RepID=UPI0031FEF3F5
MSVQRTSRRTMVAVGAVVLVAAAAAAVYWVTRPWANDEEIAKLQALADDLDDYYDANPPVAGWRIAAIAVEPPGIAITLELPAERVAVMETLPAMNRLMIAGALCPEKTDPLYTALGRFSLEIRPRSGGEPVLQNADCRNVRGVAAPE